MTTELVITRFTGRLIRRGALLLILGLASYAAIELVSYQATYPDAASRARLAAFQNNAMVRMLQGIPHGIERSGGFVAWDGGWIIALILGIWAILTVTRLTRGEEETSLAELTLVAPTSARRAMLAQFLPLTGACLLTGGAVGVVMAAAGAGTAGSLVFGTGLAGFAATAGGLALVMAQLFAVRRRAAGASVIVFVSLFLLRMVANSTDARGWLRWLTPFGWLDELRPYAGPRLPALLALAVAPVACAALAAWLRAGRDTGGALIAEIDRRRPRLRLLGGPAAFAWRAGQGVLIGWLVGLAVLALVYGMFTQTVIDLMTGDPGYRRTLSAMGMDLAHPGRGYAAMLGPIFGLVIALYACWRVGGVRAEEASQRAENILTRPVTRWRWLGAQALLTVPAVLVLVLATGLALWAGAAATGGGLSLADTLAAMAGPLPLILLFVGLALLTFSVVPRLTVAVPVGLAVTTYLLDRIGQMLKWPGPVLDLSPFHHLAMVPAHPFAALAGVSMTGLGILAVLAALWAFGRRDLADA